MRLPHPATALVTAVSWLTVLPVPTPTTAPDRRLGGAVIAAVPVVGALVGAVGTGAAFGLAHTRAPTLLIGLLVVALLALASRGMHLDGLADTADGLGCYGSPERVREVMRGGSAGPFAIATLALILGIDAVCIGTLSEQNRWYAIGFAIALGRVAAVVAARDALPPSSPDGFGALVAGTQRRSIVVWSVVATAAAYPLGPIGYVSVVAVVAGAWAVSAHCARRMAGVNGDVLGACIELSVTLTLLLLCIV